MKTQMKCCLKQHFVWLGLHCLQKKIKKIPGFTNLCLLLKIVCYYLECFQMSVNVYVVNCIAPITCNHCPLHIRMKWGHKIHCPGISPHLVGRIGSFKSALCNSNYTWVTARELPRNFDDKHKVIALPRSPAI